MADPTWPGSKFFDPDLSLHQTKANPFENLWKDWLEEALAKNNYPTSSTQSKFSTIHFVLSALDVLIKKDSIVEEISLAWIRDAILL